MRIRLILTIILLAFCLSAEAKDHAYGPWNVDLSAGVVMESNSNIYFDNSSTTSGLVYAL